MLLAGRAMSQLVMQPNLTSGTVASGATQSERSIAGAAGILGAIALSVYFTAPAFLGWPYAGASSDAVMSYANAHATLFYGGAWLQVTGTLLCVILFISLIRLSDATTSLAGMLTATTTTVLLATVVIEAAFL